jgi:5-methylthioadenosine/S-adenosylhomocysteine deaminase
MTATSSLAAADLAPGRSVVFRNATVLTLDDGHDVLDGADVLVRGERIAAVGPNLAVPEGTAEIDAAGGILMPGMIDTHRHMWQTAMRGYGADWTLTQYFVWYYLQWGRRSVRRTSTQATCSRRLRQSTPG